MSTFLAFIYAALLTIGFGCASTMMFSWRSGSRSSSDQKANIILTTIIFTVCYIMMLSIFSYGQL